MQTGAEAQEEQQAVRHGRAVAPRDSPATAWHGKQCAFGVRVEGEMWNATSVDGQAGDGSLGPHLYSQALVAADAKPSMHRSTNRVTNLSARIHQGKSTRLGLKLWCE